MWFAGGSRAVVLNQGVVTPLKSAAVLPLQPSETAWCTCFEETVEPDQEVTNRQEGVLLHALSLSTKLNGGKSTCSSATT